MTRNAKLGSLVGIRTGYLSRTRVEECPGGEYRLIQLGDFDSTRTRLNKQELVHFKPGDMRTDQTIRPDEVLFLAKGVKNFAYHPGPLPAPTLAASYFYVLTPSAEILPEYLSWFLNHPQALRIFDRIAGVGARMPVVKKSDLANIHIPLPAIRDQERILDLYTLMRHEADLLDQLKQERKTFVDALTIAIATNQIREEAPHV